MPQVSDAGAVRWRARPPPALPPHATRPPRPPGGHAWRARWEMVTREGGACCRRCREPVVARYQHWGRLSSDMWRCKAAVEEVDLSMLDSIPADERHAGMALRGSVGVVPVRACEHTCASTSASASESACAAACTGACVSCKLFTPVFLCKLKKPTRACMLKTRAQMLTKRKPVSSGVSDDAR